MTGTPGPRTGRLRVLIADDEPGLPIPTLRGTGYGVRAGEDGR
ncbi:hypothetical protein [Streptomyces sp. NPDC051636]